ncbi:AI-2E family transporter [Sphingomonas echinoides]|uniref:AI-2E family transporter n=3 Tax=Bacteria TaxID=2 RepID=A0ABU4PU47_9SPHN|nr:AI-2E family transporter [Sphingomonas echinoides]MDX5985470.1 AI-2E family transporter [Sphingomonas echinoides]
MIAPDSRGFSLERGFFLAFLMIVSLVFAWLIAPFFGAIVWAVVAAIVFAPLTDWLTATLSGRRNLATVLTLLVILLAVILPTVLLGGALLQQAAGLYAKIKSGKIDFDLVFFQIEGRLPNWVQQQLAGYGLTDFAAVRARIADGAVKSFDSLAGRAFSLGQSVFGLLATLGIMLYLCFFLLRDGRTIVAKVEHAIPLLPEYRRALFDKFAAVVRATIKGSLVVAVLQGLIGGLIVWGLGIGGALLWGVLMGAFSLLPAIGTGIVWVPMALYLLATGAIWQGIALALCGFFIISSVDNVVKPILVGRDTQMPDYVVLISTFGGLELFGFNGLVVGPVIAAMFIATWEIFSRSRDAHRGIGPR